VPFSSGDNALIKNLYLFKKYSPENTSGIFEDKLNVNRRDLGNMQHRPKARNQQTEAYTY